MLFHQLNWSLHFAPSSSLFALCSLPYALCPMPYALCPMPYALCPMPYALINILAIRQLFHCCFHTIFIEFIWRFIMGQFCVFVCFIIFADSGKSAGHSHVGWARQHQIFHNCIEIPPLLFLFRLIQSIGVQMHEFERE